MHIKREKWLSELRNEYEKRKVDIREKYIFFGGVGGEVDIREEN